MASRERVSGTRPLAHSSSFCPVIGTSYILHVPALSKIIWVSPIIYYIIHTTYLNNTAYIFCQDQQSTQGEKKAISTWLSPLTEVRARLEHRARTNSQISVKLLFISINLYALNSNKERGCVKAYHALNPEQKLKMMKSQKLNLHMIIVNTRKSIFSLNFLHRLLYRDDLRPNILFVLKDVRPIKAKCYRPVPPTPAPT